MTQSRTLLRRGSVAIATAGLVASGLVGLASTADASVTGNPAAGTGTVTWAVSELLNGRDGFPAPKGDLYTAPASFTSTGALSTWAGGSGTVEPTSGASDVTFDGASIHWAATGNAWMKLEDPEIEINAAGVGEMTAAVSYGVTTGGVWTSATATRGPARLPVLDLDPATTGTGYPYGDLAYGFSATDSTFTWTNVKGLWAPELIAFLGGDAAAEPAIPKYVYNSTIVNSVDGSSRVRYPAPITFSIDKATPKVTTSVTSAGADGLTLAFSATGFRAVTNPGDAGVYVGLAPSGGLPDVSTQASMAAFPAADYAFPSRIVDGNFTGTLHADVADLDRTKSYSVYTWQAHSHSNTTQDTETPVTIDWSKLTVTPQAPTKAATKATAKVTKKPTTSKAGALTVTLKSSGGKPAGKVTVKLTSKGKKAVTRTAKAKNGKAVVKLPKLKAGSWKATVVYTGSDDFKAAQKVVTFKVKKSKKK